MGDTRQPYIWISLFAIAMAFMESAVVIYLREIYYPEGFAFPLKAIEGHIRTTEILREAATIVMLICMSWLAGKKAIERFGWFLLSFAIWDIFYYVFLKLILGWPESLLTWDILFLIPVVWVGPVIAPLINSVIMIIFAFMIIRFSEKKKRVVIPALVWILLVTGSLITIMSYTEDYLGFMLEKFPLGEILSPDYSTGIARITATYIPSGFSWWLFIPGQLLYIAAVILFNKSNR